MNIKELSVWLEETYKGSYAGFDDGMNSIGDACSSQEQQTRVHTLYEIAKLIGIDNKLVPPPPAFEEFYEWNGIDGTLYKHKDDL